MTQRILSAAVGLVLLFAVIWDSTLTNITVTALLVIALIEFYMAYGFFKKKPLGIMGLTLPFIVVLIRAVENKLPIEIIPFLCYLYIVVLFVLVIAFHDKIHIKDIAIMFSITFLITMFFQYISIVRSLENGVFLIWTVLIGAFITDTFALFSGMLFGKHKLAPKISPKKTVEGAIGGFLGSVLGFLVFGIIMQNFFNFEVNYIATLILGGLCGIVSQIGDLSMSVMKREAGIKDFGSIMPGHGGVLDRFDSILFVAPLVYFYLQYFPIFG